MGKVFPNGDPRSELKLNYAKSIAVALRGELGDTHRAIKTVMQWTGASERTIKNWFAGSRGPSGEHLVLLLRRSDMVLQVFLGLSGREHTIAAIKLAAARDELVAPVGAHPRFGGLGAAGVA